MPLALLVDRDADTRHMYAMFLRQSAWNIDETEDGREALAKAIAMHPDVVITETRLPGMSGFDLCRLLRTDSLTRDLPIVVLTGDAFEHDVKRAENSGADVVLTKPCLPEQLVAEVGRVLERAHELRAHAAGVRAQVTVQLEQSAALIERSRAKHGAALNRAHHRHDTTTPSMSPPALLCPTCDLPLKYIKSHIGGVSVRHPEQWDYFECAGCGTFEYRHRTRKLRHVGKSSA